ncbi:DNA-binding response regulator [Thermus scotoductus]|jgi:two-component system response regulator MprA|uniref:DNA-binding response regulator n=3 Tax=Thermus TaxID=270 RepID=A0A0N0IQG4_THESC|nr:MULTISPECIES: response regulator transcription factor [Thermus]ADW22729.1 two-component response regulator [Thermus scotoductus SA-01]ETN88150.1 transcriptional regulator [Thermus sp. NMX2.A1]KPD29437.1 transcriptional regulator [Thermus scotoductus]MBW6395016.1 response regulator transcription factor [Thermus brevis]QWK22311.1 MAG: response regulator transcription factor [Thermus antranikianii]
MRVLLVEDDPGVREALELGLSLEGHEVKATESPKEALSLLPWAEVVILDVLLPERDGFSLLKDIRARSEVPVLMLTALDAVEWRVKGLKEGADDYLVKPYSLSELLARLEALWRRAHRGKEAPEVLAYKDLRLYPRRMEAFRGERRLSLPPKAFLLLKAFLESPEEVLSKEALMLRVWGEEVDPATLEVHLSLLRKALGEPNPIQTVRGYGYRLFLP